MTTQQKLDMEKLNALPEFRRFLWRVIQMGRILAPITHGSDGRHLIAEGRRQLALDLLADAELGQPVSHPDQIPILTAIQVLREEIQTSAKPEKQRDRYDRTAEIDLDDPTDPA